MPVKSIYTIQHHSGLYFRQDTNIQKFGQHNNQQQHITVNNQSDVNRQMFSITTIIPATTISRPDHRPPATDGHCHPGHQNAKSLAHPWPDQNSNTTATYATNSNNATITRFIHTTAHQHKQQPGRPSPHILHIQHIEHLYYHITIAIYTRPPKTKITRSNWPTTKVKNSRTYNHTTNISQFNRQPFRHDRRCDRRHRP